MSIKEASQPLSKRLAKNFGGTTYALTITIVTQIVSVPLFLHYWGKSLYGEWLVLSAIASYFGLSDIGFSKVTSNRMAMLTSTKDYQKALTSLHSTWTFVTGMSSLIVLIAVPVVLLIPFDQVLHLEFISHVNTTIILILLTLYALLCLQAELLAAIYRSSYHNARGVVATNTIRLGDFLLSCLALILTQSPLMISAVLFANRFVGTLLMIWDCRRIAPHLSLGWHCFDKHELRSMIRPSLAFMCFPLAHSVPSQGMTLIIHSILGPAAVVVFNTIRILTRTLSHSMSLIKGAVWPEISHLIAKRDFVRARFIYRFTVQTTVILMSVGGLILLTSGNFILAIWTQRTIDIPTVTLLLFIGGIVLNSIWLSSSVILEATNQHEGLAVRFLAGSLLSLALAFLLIPPLGINGAIVGMMVIDALLIPYVISQSCKILSESPWNLVRYHGFFPKLPFPAEARNA
jgi:O-antigen/teichoic acid export membrane protein